MDRAIEVLLLCLVATLRVSLIAGSDFLFSFAFRQENKFFYQRKVFIFKKSYEFHKNNFPTLEGGNIFQNKYFSHIFHNFIL